MEDSLIQSIQELPIELKQIIGNYCLIQMGYHRQSHLERIRRHLDHQRIPLWKLLQNSIISGHYNVFRILEERSSIGEPFFFKIHLGATSCNPNIFRYLINKYPMTEAMYVICYKEAERSGRREVMLEIEKRGIQIGE